MSPQQLKRHCHYVDLCDIVATPAGHKERKEECANEGGGRESQEEGQERNKGTEVRYCSRVLTAAHCCTPFVQAH